MVETLNSCKCIMTLFLILCKTPRTTAGKFPLLNWDSDSRLKHLDLSCPSLKHGLETWRTRTRQIVDWVVRCISDIYRSCHSSRGAGRDPDPHSHDYSWSPFDYFHTIKFLQIFCLKLHEIQCNYLNFLGCN